MPRRKALKVVVDVHFHAITCPGVFLPDQNDVFLNIDILGQKKRTKCIPPVFPFLFHEKLRFDKVFSFASDLVQVANCLSSETVRIELVQLSYPAGELLATYQENAREFLFPTPRVSPTYPGVDREILLQRSCSFPGIAPKLEFSSRTIIKEVTSAGEHQSSIARRDKKSKSISHESVKSTTATSYNLFDKYSPVEASTPQVAKQQSSASRTNSGGRKSRSKQVKTPQVDPFRRNRTCSLNRALSTKRYEQSTIASRARSPSPYTRRRMAQLTIADPFDSAVQQRPFKSELEDRPHFVIRKVGRPPECMFMRVLPSGDHDHRFPLRLRDYDPRPKSCCL